MVSYLLASNASSIVFICVIAALLIAFFVWSFISNKKKQKNFNDTINAVKPGNKVKTLGGICGIVVEVDDAENTFVLETGSETSGKCYMKFDRQAILQSDAVVEKKDDSKKFKDEKGEKEEEKPAAPAEEATAEKPEAPAEETKEN